MVDAEMEIEVTNIIRTLRAEASEVRMGSTAVENSDMKRCAGVDGGGRR